MPPCIAALLARFGDEMRLCQVYPPVSRPGADTNLEGSAALEVKMGGPDRDAERLLHQLVGAIDSKHGVRSSHGYWMAEDRYALSVHWGPSK